MGAGKARPEKRRSFIQLEHIVIYVKECQKRGRPDLCRYIQVIYTYQLRAQSEGVILQSHDLSKDDQKKDNWWSCVDISNKWCRIILRTRKNKNFKSSISRQCTHSVSEWACGKCALQYQVKLARENKQDRVFWTINNNDIKILRDIALEHNLPYPTWHGFRRGRTCDLVSMKFKGEPISLEDIFESGGWFSGSRAIMHYLRREVVDRERLINTLAELSESD